MIMLTAIIVVRSVAQSDVEVNESGWEQALHVAEGGLDVYLVDLAAAPDPDALNTGHTASQLSSKDAVIAEAETYAAANPAEVVVGPQGEAVVLKPIGVPIIYSVGWVPSRTAIGHKTRVVQIEYGYSGGSTTWSVTTAFLTGGDVNFKTASAGIMDSSGNDNANAHANGTMGKHNNFDIEGCGVSAEDDTGEGDNCPPPGPVDPMTIPYVNPREVHDLADYDPCPDGIVRFGPAHASGPGLGADPCTGTITSLPGSWYFYHFQGVPTWGMGNSPSGTFYAFETDFEAFYGSATPFQMTFIVEATGNDADCSNAVSDGNVYLTAGVSLSGDPDAGGLTLIAGGDIEMKGGAEIEGLTVAHEQIKFNGGTGNGGAVVAESACDNPDSPVNGTSLISGDAGITWSGGYSTPFQGSGTPQVLTVLTHKEN